MARRSGSPGTPANDADRSDPSPMTVMYRSFLLLACLLLAWLLVAGAAAAEPVVSGLRLGENGPQTRFVIDISQDAEAEIFTLADPYRLVIDLPATDFRTGSQGLSDGRGLVSRYRYGLFKPGVSRIVLDLEAPAALDRFFTLPPQGPHAHRLVFDLKPTSRADFLKRVKQPALVQRRPPKPRPALAAARKVREKRVVVVDAGHGGIDPGAPGALGVPEKVITLAVAREAVRRLEATGRYKAILTRDRDIYLRLRQRVDFARRAEADLFVSLHADSLDNRRVRGATVYTLSETASDKEAAALAARENKADLVAGVDLAREAPEVASILIDLAQRETMNYSARFANYLIPELKDRVTLRRNTHRFAGFVVLKAPDVPSILLEMGYLSNRQDAAMLGSVRGRTRVATALVAAVDRYFAAVDREAF